ncbi:hypothetical protein ACFLUY_03000, partial [Chloroflexota bacterium]
WVTGYAPAILLALVRLGPQEVSEELNRLYSLATKAQTWRQFDGIKPRAKDILINVPGFFRPWDKWLFRQYKPVAAIDRRSLMVPVRTPRNPEQIKGLLGNSLRIVEDQSPASALNFACLMDGAVTRARKYNEKALIAEIKHPTGGSGHDYSFAVFMPAYGGVFIPTNASCWWVFYDICNDFTGGARSVLEQIRQSLRNHRKWIEIICLSLDKTDLLDLCEDPGYRYLKQEIDYCQKLDSEIRADLPELLLAAYLGFFKAHPIRCRLKPEFLKKEIDVIGVKWLHSGPDEMVVFESKGRATTYIDLQTEVDDFAKKLRQLQANIKGVADLLSVPYSANIKLKGCFVSMSRLKPTDIRIPAGVALWDFDRFQPLEYRRLLKEKILAHVIGLDTSFNELFFGTDEE